MTERLTEAQKRLLAAIAGGGAPKGNARTFDTLREKGLITFDEKPVKADSYGRRWRRYFYNVQLTSNGVKRQEESPPAAKRAFWIGG